ncbi:MAG: ABC transporter substrate binding protein [Myxococcota bacterium]
MRWIAFAFGLAAAACTGPGSKTSVNPAASQSQDPVIVILKSSDNPLLNVPVEVFRAQTTEFASIHEMVLGDNDLMEAIEALEPDLVFSLGARATNFAQTELVDTPCVFTLVVNHERIGALDASRSTGVALEVPAVAEFTQFKIAVPTMKHVFTVVDAASDAARIAKLRKDLQMLGIQLTVERVSNAVQLKNALASRPLEVDALWLPTDPSLLNQQNFEVFRSESSRGGLPLLASLSDEFVKAGALVGVSVDFTTLGSQSAVLARSILLSGTDPAQLDVQDPIGVRLVVNADVADDLGHEIPEDAYPFINDFVQTRVGDAR